MHNGVVTSDSALAHTNSLQQHFALLTFLWFDSSRHYANSSGTATACKDHSNTQEHGHSTNLYEAYWNNVKHTHTHCKTIHTAQRGQTGHVCIAWFVYSNRIRHGSPSRLLLLVFTSSSILSQINQTCSYLTSAHFLPLFCMRVELWLIYNSRILDTLGHTRALHLDMMAFVLYMNMHLDVLLDVIRYIEMSICMPHPHPNQSKYLSANKCRNLKLNNVFSTFKLPKRYQ